MDSFFARNRLSAYLDGALPPAEAREVAAAIERDPDLASEYDALRRTVALLQQEGPVQAPAGFHARLMAKVAEEQPPAGNVVRLRRWFARLPVEAVALAAAAAVVVIAIQWQPEAPAEPAEGEDHAAAAPKDAPAPPEKAEQVAEEHKEAQQAAAPGEAKPEPPPVEAAEPAVADAGTQTTTKQQRAVPAAKAAEQTYVPEWETSEDHAVAAVRGMQLSVGNPQVLIQLEQVARRASGRLTDAGGRSIKAEELSAEAPNKSVMLVVPADRANEVEDRLKSFGARSGKAPSGLMVGSGNAAFYLEVHLSTD